MPRRPRTAATWVAAALLVLSAAPAVAAADTQPPTAPAGLRVLAVSPTVVTVAFTGSTDDVGLRWYVLRGAGREQATTSPARTEFGGLRSETTYTLDVVAVDRAGNVSAPSAPVRFTTGSWPAVTGLTVTAASGGSVSLAWDRYSAMDPYRFLVYDRGNAEAVVKGERVTLTGLAAGSHTFTVRGLHVTSSVTAASSPVTVVVAPRGTDTTVPTPPGVPTVRMDEESYEFTTTWAPSTDPFDPPASLRYDVLQLWAGQYFTVTYGVAGTSYAGAFASAVRAADPAGNRSAPAVATFVP